MGAHRIHQRSLRPREKQLIYRLKCHGVCLCTYQPTSRQKQHRIYQIKYKFNIAPAAAAPESRIFSFISIFTSICVLFSCFIETWRARHVLARLTTFILKWNECKRRYCFQFRSYFTAQTETIIIFGKIESGETRLVLVHVARCMCVCDSYSEKWLSTQTRSWRWCATTETKQIKEEEKKKKNITKRNRKKGNFKRNKKQTANFVYGM